MRNNAFDQLQQLFSLTLGSDSPDFAKLEQCLLDFELVLKKQIDELNPEDWQNYQNWLQQVIPQLEQYKSLLAVQLGQVQQGKKALGLYHRQVE